MTNEQRPGVTPEYDSYKRGLIKILRNQVELIAEKYEDCKDSEICHLTSLIGKLNRYLS